MKRLILLTACTLALAACSNPEEERKAQEAAAAAVQAQKEAKADATGAARTHLLSYIQLGADVASDPTVQKLVEKLEPPGAGHDGHAH